MIESREVPLFLCRTKKLLIRAYPRHGVVPTELEGRHVRNVHCIGELAIAWRRIQIEALSGCEREIEAASSLLVFQVSLDGFFI